jgi:hypothetical protein
MWYDKVSQSVRKYVMDRAGLDYDTMLGFYNDDCRNIRTFLDQEYMNEILIEEYVFRPHFSLIFNVVCGSTHVHGLLLAHQKEDCHVCDAVGNFL